jgi:hypothetical protein
MRVMPRRRSPSWLALLLIACGGDGSTSATGGPDGTAGAADGTATTASDTTASDTTGGSENAPTILSAYYGLDMLPAAAALLCGMASVGEDGMPVTFSVQLDAATVAPAAFTVETASGELVNPTCATLAPANETLELRTVLLAGPFGTPDAQPVAVSASGLRTLAGETIDALTTDTITPLENGPSLLLAQRFAPNTPGLEDECPSGTSQAIQLVWEGGVTGPAGAALAEEQRIGVRVRLENGETVEPVALGDDDPDNFVIACVAESSPAVQVDVDAGLFHDPGDDANPPTSVAVTPD